MLQIAALLIALLGLAHSVLGERYILVRLFRRDLPKLFGGTRFTRNTLRFAWHLTTMFAWGISAILFQLSGAASPQALAQTVGWCLVLGPASACIHPRAASGLGGTVRGRWAVSRMGRP